MAMLMSDEHPGPMDLYVPISLEEPLVFLLKRLESGCVQ